MTSKTFTAGTVIDSAWLNDVNNSVYGSSPTKTTPVDADTLPLNDSASSAAPSKISWSSIKTTIKTYLDGFYAGKGSNADITTLSALTTISTASPLSLTNGQLKFPATQNPSADVNTLDDYEEGTWSPAITSQTGAITSYTASGSYTKIGRVVVCQISISITNAGTGAGAVQVSNLPFSMTNSFANGSGRENASTGKMLNLWGVSTTVFNMANYDNTTTIATGASLVGTFTYFA